MIFSRLVFHFFFLLVALLTFNSSTLTHSHSPSGAGKTSLLNILAGRASSHGGKIKITADVRLNNYAVNPANIAVRQLIAFVAQDDSLQVTSTPREAIYFSAKLRLPRSTPNGQLEKLTTRMIDELGLRDCADTIVGGELIKGISGGERKRTSVGVELVTKPALVFLGELYNLLVLFHYCMKQSQSFFLSFFLSFLPTMFLFFLDFFGKKRRTNVWVGFIFCRTIVSSLEKGGECRI